MLASTEGMKSKNSSYIKLEFFHACSSVLRFLAVAASQWHLCRVGSRPVMQCVGIGYASI